MGNSTRIKVVKNSAIQINNEVYTQHVLNVYFFTTKVQNRTLKRTSGSVCFTRNSLSFVV
jgi:hypothetical protein